MESTFPQKMYWVEIQIFLSSNFLVWFAIKHDNLLTFLRTLKHYYISNVNYEFERLWVLHRYNQPSITHIQWRSFFFFSCFFFDKKVTFYLFIGKDISLLVKFRGLFTFGGLRWLLNSLIARANQGYNDFKSCLFKSLVLQFVSWREEFHTHNWHDKYDVVCSPSTL